MLLIYSVLQEMHPESDFFSPPSLPLFWSKPHHLSPALLQLLSTHFPASFLILLEYLPNRAARMILLKCNSDDGIYLFKPPPKCSIFLMVYPTTSTMISYWSIILLPLSPHILLLIFLLSLLHYSHIDILAVVQTC